MFGAQAVRAVERAQAQCACDARGRSRLGSARPHRTLTSQPAPARAVGLILSNAPRG